MSVNGISSKTVSHRNKKQRQWLSRIYSVVVQTTEAQVRLRNAMPGQWVDASDASSFLACGWTDSFTPIISRWQKAYKRNKPVEHVCIASDAVLSDAAAALSDLQSRREATVALSLYVSNEASVCVCVCACVTRALTANSGLWLDGSQVEVYINWA